MGKIANGVNKINFTMLYGNYCYIIIENFPQKFSPCRLQCTADILSILKQSTIQFNNQFFIHFVLLLPYNSVGRGMSQSATTLFSYKKKARQIPRHNQWGNK